MIEGIVRLALGRDKSQPKRRQGRQDRRGQGGKWGTGAGTSHSPYYTPRRDVPGAGIRWRSRVGAVACPCPGPLPIPSIIDDPFPLP